MNASKLPDKPSHRAAIDSFLQRAEQLPARRDGAARQRARLIFALDANASHLLGQLPALSGRRG